MSTKSRTRGSAVAYCSLGTKTGSQEAISQEAGAPSMKAITALSCKCARLSSKAPTSAFYSDIWVFFRGAGELGPQLIVLKDSSCWGLGHIYSVGMEPESTMTTRASPLDLTLLNSAPDTTFLWETHFVSPSQSLDMIQMG